MNGGIRFSSISGLSSVSTSHNSDLPFLPNTLGNSVNNISGSQATFSEAFGNMQTGNASYDTNARRLTGNQIGGSSEYGKWSDENNFTVIDDDELREQQYLEHSPDTSSDEPTLEDLSSPANVAEETGIEASEITADSVELLESATPWGLAAVVNQQIGSSLNSILTAQSQNVASQNYMTNMNQHGVNVGLNASLIQQQQDQTIRNQQTYGNFGSILGPIGTLIGHAIAGTVQANPSMFQTAASSGGWVNPTDTVASNSASSATQSGQSTMIDNVDN